MFSMAPKWLLILWKLIGIYIYDIFVILIHGESNIANSCANYRSVDKKFPPQSR